MVKNIGSMVLCALIFTLTACKTPEFEVYTRSLSGTTSDYFSGVVPTAIFSGLYQILGYQDEPTGALSITPAAFMYFGGNGVINTKADGGKAPDDNSHLIKINNVIQLRDRLFLEIKINTKSFGFSRFTLFEILVTKDKMMLIPMVFDRKKLFENNLNFSRKANGPLSKDMIVVEVQNRDTDTSNMVAAMVHKSKYDSLSFRPMSQSHDQTLRRELHKMGIRIQESPFACAITLANQGPSAGGVVTTL